MVWNEQSMLPTESPKAFMPRLPIVRTHLKNIAIAMLIMSLASFLIRTASGQVQQEQVASIGPGTQYIHYTIIGTSCGQPVSIVGDFTVYYGPLTLRSDLPLV